MADCIIRAGESVDLADPRLSDTACQIETGVIIMPPPDLSVASDLQPEPRPAQAVAAMPAPKVTAVVVKEVVEKVATPASAKTIETLPAKEVVVDNQATPPAIDLSPEMLAHTLVPEQTLETKQSDEPSALNTTTMAIAAGAVIAVAGTAAAGGVSGGFSSMQAKLASMFGTSKATVVTATVVTAGTIVAVKALEKKMNTLERDIEKTKKEVGDAASSIDRIDSLLDKLGS
jgi:hypothetical protein